MKQDFPFDPSTVLLPGLQDRPIDAPGGTFHLPTTTFGDPRAFRSQGYTNFSVHKGFSKGSKINPGWPRSLRGLWRSDWWFIWQLLSNEETSRKPGADSLNASSESNFNECINSVAGAMSE